MSSAATGAVSPRASSASSVFERPIVKVIKASFAYAVIMLIALALVTYVPWLSLALLDR